MSKSSKRSYQSYDPVKLQRALESVRNNELSMRKASVAYSIAYTTLNSHFHGTHSKKVGHPSTLNQEKEEELVKVAQSLLQT